MLASVPIFWIGVTKFSCHRIRRKLCCNQWMFDVGWRAIRSDRIIEKVEVLNVWAVMVTSATFLFEQMLFLLPFFVVVVVFVVLALGRQSGVGSRSGNVTWRWWCRRIGHVGLKPPDKDRSGKAWSGED